MNDVEEFNGIEKGRGAREIRRLNRQRKIESRKRKILNVCPSFGEKLVDGGSTAAECFSPHHLWHDGRLENNNEMNRAFGKGIRVKVNQKKRHASYRCKMGGYGSAMWPSNALRQIVDSEQQLEEYYNGEYDKEAQ